MDESIRHLIHCEGEAKEKIKVAHQYKEGMKKQAMHDAELSVQMFESENEQKLENMRNQTESYLAVLRNELEDELRLFEEQLAKKDLDTLAENLALAISKNNK